MTIERTRKIFGSKMKHMSDEQVLRFIGDMSIVGDELLKTALTSAKNFDHTDKEQG